jgi:hypothetical protein
MILAVILLLAASAGRLVVMDETVQVPAQQWQAFDLELKQMPAVVECRYSVAGKGAGVRLALMHRADEERFRAGMRHHVLAATEFQRSGGLRFRLPNPGEYSVVLDNRLEGRGAAQVQLTVSVLFPGAVPEPAGLPPGRKWTVVLLAFLYIGAVMTFAVRRLGSALIGKRPRRQ